MLDHLVLKASFYSYSTSRVNHGGMESKGGWTVVRRCSPGGGWVQEGRTVIRSIRSIRSIGSIESIESIGSIGSIVHTGNIPPLK